MRDQGLVRILAMPSPEPRVAVWLCIALELMVGTPKFPETIMNHKPNVAMCKRLFTDQANMQRLIAFFLLNATTRPRTEIEVVACDRMRLLRILVKAYGRHVDYSSEGDFSTSRCVWQGLSFDVFITPASF